MFEEFELKLNDDEKENKQKRNIVFGNVFDLDMKKKVSTWYIVTIKNIS